MSKELKGLLTGAVIGVICIILGGFLVLTALLTGYFIGAQAPAQPPVIVYQITSAAISPAVTKTSIVRSPQSKSTQRTESESCVNRQTIFVGGPPVIRIGNPLLTTTR